MSASQGKPSRLQMSRLAELRVEIKPLARAELLAKAELLVKNKIARKS